MKSSIRRRVLMAGVVVSGMPAWTALADDGPARSWIGVELGEVPEMLALHLKLGGGGLLITNVAAAGPSEKAQLSRYDVIVKLNDDPVVNNIPAFIARVARLHPGEEIGLGIISRGDRRQVKLRLGVRPDDEIKWLYEPSRPSWEEVIKVRPPRILELGNKDGRRVFRPLKRLPKRIADLLGDCFEIEIQHCPLSRRLSVASVRDGVRITVVREGEGKITVTRTEGKGEKRKITTKSYDTVDELAEGDPEAHGLLKDGDARKGLDAWNWGLRFGLKFDTDDIRKLHDDADALKDFWNANRGDIERHLKDLPGLFDLDIEGLDKLDFDRDKWLRDPQKALEDARKRIEKLTERIFPRSSPAPPQRPPGPKRPAPRTQFDVQPDGTIKIETTVNDQTLTLHVKNEQEFAEKYPKLYRQYQDLRGGLK